MRYGSIVGTVRLGRDNGPPTGHLGTTDDEPDAAIPAGTSGRRRRRLAEFITVQSSTISASFLFPDVHDTTEIGS